MRVKKKSSWNRHSLANLVVNRSNDGKERIEDQVLWGMPELRVFQMGNH